MDKKSYGYWTKEQCQEEALKYEYLKDFRQSDAYHVSSRLGVLKEITKNLKKEDKHIYKLKKIDAEYNVDHYQFFNITKPEVSYILGFIWADGSLSKNGYSINIYCKYDDNINSDFNTLKSILNKIGKWNTYIRKKYDKRTDKYYNSAMFFTSNKFLFNFLIEMDYDKKSYISPEKILNKIPIYLHNHFYRGYSDGDGCFYIKNNKSQYSLTSTIEQDWIFMENIFSILNVKNTSRTASSKKINSKYSQIRITNKIDITKYGDWLYINSDNLRFERKYNKFCDIKKIELKQITRTWTDSEIDFLLKNYRTKKGKYCANELNRTLQSVQSKVSNIGKEYFM